MSTLTLPPWISNCHGYLESLVTEIKIVQFEMIHGCLLCRFMEITLKILVRSWIGQLRSQLLSQLNLLVPKWPCCVSVMHLLLLILFYLEIGTIWVLEVFVWDFDLTSRKFSVRILILGTQFWIFVVEQLSFDTFVSLILLVVSYIVYIVNQFFWFNWCVN